MDIRSISLPSRLHPTQFEAQLEKLKSISLTSNTIISSLATLAELYNNSINNNLTQIRSIDHALEASVALLDCCSSIREVAQMGKESGRALQSALRRKGLQNDVASYVESRKRVSKCVKKCLKELKKFEGGIHASDVLRGVAVGVFRSALFFFSSSSSFSVRARVARVVRSKCEHQDDDQGVVNEVGCVDLALRDGGFDKERVLMSLQNLDCCVDGIEEGLERVFRELVKSRVNLLNILTNH